MTRFKSEKFRGIEAAQFMGVQAGLAAPSPTDWIIRDEPSATGDIAKIDILTLPPQPGYTAAFFEIAVDDGSTASARIERLLMGPALKHVRRIRVTAGRENAASLRIIWTETDTGFELAGEWSTPKTVFPSVGAPELRITASRGTEPGTAVAPAGIQFRAEGLGFGVLRPFHALRYRWTFPEAGAWKRLSPEHPWDRDRSAAYGPVAGFTFEKPGTHTVLCEATDGKHSVAGRLTITIDDPLHVFARNMTHAVSQNGDWSGAPAQAVRHRSIGAAIKATRRSPDARILLRRGERFSKLGRLRKFRRLQIGAFGSGADPVLTSGLGGRDIDQEISVWSLAFEGGYDPTLLSAQQRPSDGISLSNLSCHATVHDCALNGIDTGIKPAGAGGTTVITDTRITNWHNYGMHSGDVGDVSVAGVSLLQNPKALFAPSGKSHKNDPGPPMFADHGPLRFSRPQGALSFDNCDIFTNSDWTRQQAAVQTPYRINTGGVFPMTAVLSRQRVEGGWLSFGSDNPDKQTSPADLLIDKIIYLTTKGGGALLRLRHGGATLRNAVLVQDNVPPEGSRALRSFLYSGAPLSGAGSYTNDAAANPINIYNVTLVDLRQPHYFIGNNGNRQDVEVLRLAKDPPQRLSLGNIVVHAPNADPPLVADAPLDQLPGPSPHYPGRRVFAEAEFSYSSATGRLPHEAEVTGSRSGARGRLMTLSVPERGSFRTGDAEGILSLHVLHGAFEPGDELRDKRARLTLSGIITAPSEVMTRFANTPGATASFRPLEGSNALGDADLSLPVAIDDLTGRIRPGFSGGPPGLPARGALESE